MSIYKPTGLEIPILAALAVATPGIAQAQQQCDETPIAVIGNSHMAFMSDHARAYGIDTKNLWFDDHYSSTPNHNGCREQNNCDLYSFVAANLIDIKKRMPRIVQKMKQTGSHRIILHEGTNSLSSPREHIVKRLKYIIDYAHDPKKNGHKRIRIYLSEIPIRIIGAPTSGQTSFLSKDNVDWYNRMIRKIGADGVIRTKYAPWKNGKLHAYTKQTFPFWMYRFHKSVNPGCGYAKIRYPAKKPYRRNNGNHR
jgi:hypothetical protein